MKKKMESRGSSYIKRLRRKNVMWLVLWTELIVEVHMNPYVEVLILKLQNMTIFGDWVFQEVIKLKMRPLGWGLNTI